MRQKRRILILVAVMGFLQAKTAAADDLSQTLDQKFGLQFHGFVSQGGLTSTANNYLAYSHPGSVDYTEIALNATKTFGDNFRLGLQFFVNKLGPGTTFIPTLDWAYLDWHRFDAFGLRAGRIKVPYGLYNEETDYDPAHLSIFLPQSVYPITLRDFLLAAVGLNFYGYGDLGRDGGLAYSVVAGASFLNTSGLLPPGATINVPFTLVARLIWETPLTGLRFAVSALWVRLDFNVTQGTNIGTGPLPYSLYGQLTGVPAVVSFDYVHKHFRLTGEYSDWLEVFTSDREQLIPNSSVVSERFYLDSEYTIIEPVSVGLYYSVLFPVISVTGGGPENYQHDLAATVRWDITNYWLVKFEAHFMHGTAALTPTLNEGVPLSDLTPNWGFFAAKITAYF